MLDGGLYVVVTNCICGAMLMELQWIMPAPPFDVGKKTRSRLILVDRLTLPRVAVRWILWSLSMHAVDRRWDMSGGCSEVGWVKGIIVDRRLEGLALLFKDVILCSMFQTWNDMNS